VFVNHPAITTVKDVLLALRTQDPTPIGHYVFVIKVMLVKMAYVYQKG